MVYLIGVIISLASLGLNYAIYRRITATYLLGSVEETELSPYFCRCMTVIGEVESQPEQTEAHDPQPAVASTHDYGAWKNQKEIPWIPPMKAPEPIVKPPNRGPLARPDGFV